VLNNIPPLLTLIWKDLKYLVVPGMLGYCKETVIRNHKFNKSQ
jgi:hypothetical protein